MDDQLEKLRALYEKTVGRKPGPNARANTIITRLEKEGVDVSMFKTQINETVQEEPKEEAKAEAPKEVAKPEPAPKKVVEVIKDELVRGRGRTTQYLVYFRGQARWWTQANIEAMRSYAKEIEFPEGTPYTGAATYSKCKSCG